MGIQMNEGWKLYVAQQEHVLLTWKCLIEILGEENSVLDVEYFCAKIQFC